MVPAGADVNYERLELIQRVEAFDHALESTSGLDLYKILWLKSANRCVSACVCACVYVCVCV